MPETEVQKELLITVTYHHGQRDRAIDKCLNLGCCMGGSITSNDDKFCRFVVCGTMEQKELIDAFPEVDILAWRDED